jgi:hypothetical protein
MALSMALDRKAADKGSGGGLSSLNGGSGLAAATLPVAAATPDGVGIAKAFRDPASEHVYARSLADEWRAVLADSLRTHSEYDRKQMSALIGSLVRHSQHIHTHTHTPAHTPTPSVACRLSCRPLCWWRR